MKYKRFTDNERLAILNEAETTNKSVGEICKRHGVSTTSFYKWKAYYEAPSKVFYKRDSGTKRSSGGRPSSGLSNRALLELKQHLDKANKLFQKIYAEQVRAKKRARKND